MQALRDAHVALDNGRAACLPGGPDSTPDHGFHDTAGSLVTIGPAARTELLTGCSNSSPLPRRRSRGRPVQPEEGVVLPRRRPILPRHTGRCCHHRSGFSAESAPRHRPISLDSDARRPRHLRLRAADRGETLPSPMDAVVTERTTAMVPMHRGSDHASEDLGVRSPVRNHLESQGGTAAVPSGFAGRSPRRLPLICMEIAERNFFLYCDSASARRSKWVRDELRGSPELRRSDI